MLYDKGGRGRRLLQHPPVIVYFFCKYISSYLLFFISLCSILMPLELGTGSNMSRETPDFLGLELRKLRHRSRYFYFLPLVAPEASYLIIYFLFFRRLRPFLIGMLIWYWWWLSEGSNIPVFSLFWCVSVWWVPDESTSTVLWYWLDLWRFKAWSLCQSPLFLWAVCIGVPWVGKVWPSWMNGVWSCEVFYLLIFRGVWP